MTDFTLVLCEGCGTEGRIYVEVGRHWDGNYIIEDGGECDLCNGTGRAFVECEPITIEDLDHA